MIDYFKISTPIYGTVDVQIDDFIKELKTRLRQAKVENKHFNHKCIKFSVTIDDNHQLWLTGYSKKDLN
jgi:hypothetical protein